MSIVHYVHYGCHKDIIYKLNPFEEHPQTHPAAFLSQPYSILFVSTTLQLTVYCGYDGEYPDFISENVC